MKSEKLVTKLVNYLL